MSSTISFDDMSSVFVSHFTPLNTSTASRTIFPFILHCPLHCPTSIPSAMKTKGNLFLVLILAMVKAFLCISMFLSVLILAMIHPGPGLGGV